MTTSSSFLNHFEELRKRLLFCFYISIAFFGVCWFFKNQIISFISLPILPYLNEEKLIFTAPQEEFLALIKVCFLGSLILSFPFILYQAWRFLSPGLHSHEKRSAFVLSFIGSVLFIGGFLFSYKIVYPLSFQFLLNFGSSLPLISIKEYLSFFIQVSLVFSLLFETPLVIFGLVWFQILHVSQLKKGRKYALIILALTSALVTPPDALSMILLLIPLYLLYEVSIWFCEFFLKP